ncbi:MAG: hypothetical protein M1497_05690 [Nitrospirae bacterium]|nr:hypothetical protein [Nitrospirota bacterium]
MEETRLLGLDLSVASPEVIELLLEDVSHPEVFDEILKSNAHRPEILRLLTGNPAVPERVREEAGKRLNLPARAPQPPRISEEARKHNLLQKIQKLSVGEKIAIALRGGQEIRSILLKDSNKEVVLTVLKNPKITDTEVELIAHSRNVPEEALRAIHKNREWMKNYHITLALVNNPKTPPGIGITLVTGLRLKDIAVLEKNRNVPEAIRSAAKRVLQARKVH